MTPAMANPLGRLLRLALRETVPYKAGTSVAAVQRRFGIARPVKLSQNENPLGSSPNALAAVRALASLSDYDEDDHAQLRERLARSYGLDVASVILGHGSNELIALVFAAFVDPGDEVVFAQPTFSLFLKDAKAAAARPIEVPLRDGVHDLGAMLAAVTRMTKVVIVCDPNNPTGTRVDRDAFAAFAKALPADVLLVIDQAYREFMDPAGTDGVDIVRVRPATLVLRTASKIYGLASVRFGYGYSSPEIVDYLNRVRVPFNVARPAAVAVLAALDDDAFIERSRRSNAEGRTFLTESLRAMGLHVYPSAANFVAVEVPIGADAAYEALLRQGVIVRSGDGLRMPGRLRVTVGTREQNEAFLAAIEALLPAWRAELAGSGATR